MKKSEVRLETAYCKKLGLPNFSSHSFIASIHVECDSKEEAVAEAARLYDELQAVVDKKLEQVGWLPEFGRYGMLECGEREPSKEEWRCTPAQRALIVNFVDNRKLDRNEVEKVSQRVFKTRVRKLTSIQAAEFIERLAQEFPAPPGNDASAEAA